MNTSAHSSPLAGSERTRPDSHRLLGRVDPGKVIGLTVMVRHRPGSPPLPSLEDWHSTPPGQRHALSREEYARTYGADRADLDKVRAFAAAHGLAVTETHPGRRAVTLQGQAAQFEAAFGVTLNHYEGPLPSGGTRPGLPTGAEPGTAETAAPTQVHQGYDGQVQLPEELAGIVLAVIGLDDRTRGVTAGTPAGGNDPPGASSFSVLNLAQHYNFPNLVVPDQTIGVLAPQPVGSPGQGPSYLSTDIPGVTINDVNLIVNGTKYQNSSAAVQAVTASNLGSAANGGILELTQDITTSSTVAQGATVNVYFTASNEQGWLVFLNRVLLPETTENGPTVVTCSWTLDLGDDYSYVGALSEPGSIVSLLTAQFQALAGVGVYVFIAQGDWGADNWWNLGPPPATSNTPPDGKSHVMYPASDPWVTSCGGTVLGTTEEWAWGDAYTNSGFGSPNSNRAATGGGVSQIAASHNPSTLTTAPPYQTAAGITGATSTNSSGSTAFQTGRAVPDVAGLVSLTGFLVNGFSYSFIGTSCVAPLYAGLAAVLRSALGTEWGPLNETLYALKDVAFNAITQGNNSSNDTPANVALAIPGYTGTTPNAPYFPAGPGCTGLGSIDGTKLLNGIASLLYNPNFYFQVNKGSFGLDEVNVTASYPQALWLVLEGYTPNAVTAALTAAGIAAPAVQTSVTGVTVTVGAPQPEIQTQLSTPQRVLFPCTVSFATPAKTVADGGIFPVPGSPPLPTTVPLISSVTAPDGTILSAETDIELEPGADPFFSNFDPAGTNRFSVSQDLRVFTVTPGINNAPIDGIAFKETVTTDWDTAGAYGYIQALLSHLNSANNDPSNGDVFTLFPDQTNALSGDSSVTPFSINPSPPQGQTFDPTNPFATGFANYNFAVARVRLSGVPNSSSEDNVRVLFRLFAAETGDTDYQPSTYPAATTDGHGQPLAPGLGTGNVTIPFFATGNYLTNSDFAANVDYSATSINNQPVPIGASGEAYAYYGCYLNIYNTSNTINGTPVQTLLPSTHSCIVAQLVYDDAPAPGPGVLQGPEWSSNFAQRNLQITHSDNPGPASTHRVPQTFDARPGPAPGSGQLGNYPDELMIEWGNTPPGAKASIYWPQVASADVLALAKTLYSTHQLSAADANTIQCTVPNGFTFVPIPAGTGENFAGLFTVDLPQGVTAGQEFVITVRRLSTQTAAAPPPPPPAPQLSRAGRARQTTEGRPRHVMLNWRNIVGTFTVRIPVTTAQVMLPLEENTLAIMKWRLNQLTPSNRWVPVLERYIGYVEGRIEGLGGNPRMILPSPWGAKGGPLPAGGNGGRCERRHQATGKVDGVSYDRFGDFEGFLLLTEEGDQRTFCSREAEIESLARFALEERAVITVLTETHQPDRPVGYILRRTPQQPRRRRI
jgi:hypothetical protein